MKPRRSAGECYWAALTARWRCSATLDPATLLDSAAFGRRTFLKGSTAVAGTLASLSAFGKLVAEAFAQTPTFPVPEAARTPEAGLAAFVAKWQAAGPAIVLTRFGRFLSNRIFNILDRVLDPNEPDFTYIALLFDGPYALAAALRDGELTQRQYRDDRVGDAGLRALYDKVEMVPDLTMGVFGAEVTVTVGGQDYTSFVDCIRENVNAGFSANDKFQLTAAEVLSASRMRQVLDAIDHLEQFADVRGFTRLL